ncbi:MAG: hypothetical protein AAFZ65_09325 [Planctomycetota bacterium]
MKQILVVLLLTALAAGGFVAARMLSESADEPGPTVSQPDRPLIDAPRVERPTTPGTGAQPGGADAEPGSGSFISVEAALPPDLWKESAEGDLLVPREEQWWVDLSEVDFSADPVLAWEGGEVTQLEMRRALCSWLASPLLEALASAEVARAKVTMAGVEPVAFTQEQLDRRFDLWCEGRGLDPDFGAAFMAQAFKLPELASRRFYDAAGQFQLIDAVGAARSEAHEAHYLDGIPDHMHVVMRNTVEKISGLVGSAAEGSDDDLRQVLTLLEQISLMRTSQVREDLGQRLWNHFDHPLPDDAVLGVAIDDPQDGAAPWTMENVAYVSMDDVWSLLDGGLNRVQLETVLREYLYFDVLFDHSRAEGLLAEDQADWVRWSDEFDEAMGTALGAKAMQIEILGFPSLDVVRMSRRVEHAFGQAMGPDWRSTDDLRAFYRRNRMLIEGWSVAGHAAFFPAVSPQRMADAMRERGVEPGNYAEFTPEEAQAMLSPDWDQAKAEAEALLERHTAGEDFGGLAREHTAALTRMYQETRGQGAAEGFASAFGTGQFSQSLNQLGRTMRLGPYRRTVRCGGSLVSALVFEEDGGPIGPLRTPLGYVVLQVDRIGLPALEREFEDVEFQTEYTHREAAQMAWANEILRGSGLSMGNQ